MVRPSRFAPTQLIPSATGLIWIWLGAQHGPIAFLVATAPGALLLTTGISSWLYPGDRRTTPLLALGATISAGLSVPMAGLLGLWISLGLLVASVASLWSAGRIYLREEPSIPGVPAREPALALDAECAMDQLVLVPIALRNTVPEPAAHERILGELTNARSLLSERGWLADPGKFHRQPGPPARSETRRATLGSLSYEHLEFESEYEPWPDEPGRDRWLRQTANRRCHAWVLRHGAPRPWLVCIHGYEMGLPHLDLNAFRARRLHDHFGMNLAFPTLPLHGLRREGRRNGDGYLGADLLDTVHAQAQAAWDLRRLLLWIRSQWSGPIGAYGLSLGGYNAALLASLEPLDAVVAGIPATDFGALAERHGPALHLRAAQARGLDPSATRELFRVVSPLALSPRVARDRRAIFAGVADAIVPPDQPLQLWRHWERPRMVWYQGGHVTFRRHASVDRLLEDTLRVGGILPDREEI